ncbi:unnamed protein product, partial [Ectocarpus fasciculatus]
MPILEDLVSATSQGGALFGFTLRKIIELFASLACHDHMPVHPDGRSTNKTQRRLLETPYIGCHGLSPTQYSFLVGLYEGSELEGFGVAIDDALPRGAPPADGTPPLVGRYFACDFGPTCCGRSMKVSSIDAVAHTIGKSFAAKHITKRCVGDCKSVFYLNKRTYHEELGEDGLRTHTFYP